jgi:site-specific DNA-cytosine methylase
MYSKSESPTLPKSIHELPPTRTCAECGVTSPFSFPAGQGSHQHDWEHPRVIDGKLNPDWVGQLMSFPEGWLDGLGISRLQQLKMLGNAVIPAIPCILATAINDFMEQEKR